MNVNLRRPILVGGVGLSFLLWLWQGVDDTVGQLGEYAVWSAIALGGVFLLRQKKAKQTQVDFDLSLVERATVVNAIAQAQKVIDKLELEAVNGDLIAKLREKVAEVTAKLDRQELSLAIAGGKAVGKTTLRELLAESWLTQIRKTVNLQETPALFVADEAGKLAEAEALKVATNADVLLFVINGDLTDSEWQSLQQLKAANQRFMLVFNKEDQYLPEDREIVLQQIRQRMQGILEKEDVIAIAANPKAIKVRQYQTDGSMQEWLEESVPAISPLTERLNVVLTQQSQQLVWATTWREAVALKGEAKEVLNGVRRERSLPIIEQYQWISAAAAFANPVPVLDLVATGAINAQMVLDLANIYQQKFSLEQAQTVAVTMGSAMLKLGLVELSTQTISSFLKTHAITFVAGGVVQGISAAYLTRVAGLSLIEYFQEQEISADTGETAFSVERLKEKLQGVFLQNQRVVFLQSFVQQVVGKLMPNSSQLELSALEKIG
ncbi:YcjF family protein [Aerosakkonemataceae cyanobacterium BLCC-F50]|uniref:YcjF family protein n=1 Tax=Floridaenema flaviceps BLCC-F50 TaxID=3153642 RepID=A0ABV4XYE9_9CYAN